jgi:hypothetical protein
MCYLVHFSFLPCQRRGESLALNTFSILTAFNGHKRRQRPGRACVRSLGKNLEGR